MRAVAHAGRHTHHILAAKPHLITNHQRIRTPSRRENRVRNPTKIAKMPHTAVQNRPPTRKTARRRLAGGHHRTKNHRKNPGGPCPPSFPTGNQIDCGNFNTPVGRVWIPVLQCRWGCVFSDSSTPSSASTVVCGGRKRKGRRNPPLFPPPQTTARGKSARYFQRETGAALPCKNGNVGLMELRRRQ